jgi:hypothetical protein
VVIRVATMVSGPIEREEKVQVVINKKEKEKRQKDRGENERARRKGTKTVVGHRSVSCCVQEIEGADGSIREQRSTPS